MGDKLAEKFAREVCTFKYLPPEESLPSTRVLNTTQNAECSGEQNSEECYPEYDITEQVRAVSPVESPALALMLNFPGTVSKRSTYLQPIFSMDTGEIVSFEERWYTDKELECNAQNSMSIRRAPDPKSFNILRGNTGNVPFLPAGFDADTFKFSDHLDEPLSPDANDELRFLDFEELLTQPPGFDELIDLSFPITDDATDKKADEREEVEDELTEAVENQKDDDSDEEIEGEGMFGTGSESNIFDVLREISNSIASTSQGGVCPIINCSDLSMEDEKVLQADTQENKLEQKDQKAKAAGINSQFEFARRLDISRPSTEYHEMFPTMVKRYAFPLDPFQQQAVVCLENGWSVFVAAHTSAGKTVVAEYAIALCKTHRTRVIYTSPIKALSNQKFREFRNAFQDVGLVTGDIQMHTDAFCLVMTTEILRSMLYNGSEVIRELEWVIFDEVHYINDAERGHVWEEVLIMLPSHVKIVMLSATVPNCLEFADWVGRIKNRVIYVIQTMKRPVPLEHFLYTGQDGRTKANLFKIVDKDGDFSTNGYRKAEESKEKKEKDLAKRAQDLSNRGGFRGGGQGSQWQTHRSGGGGGGRPAAAGKRPDNSRNIYLNLLEHLRVSKLLPAVVFIFSRNRCDLTARLLQSVDLTSAKEKWKIKQFFVRCIDKLKGSDKDLPQVRTMQELCIRGFAVHHAGILPIVKEVVELLFQKGLVQMLFATETFAMGVNMPARTVVFDNLEKFDSKGIEGERMRPLNPTEYVQMAGRAGRRGLDETGTVIILQKDFKCTSVAHLKSIILGKPVNLESQFRITYGMMLNLLRVERIKIEDMLQRSYIERSSLRLVITRKERIQQVEEQIASLPDIDCKFCCDSIPVLAASLRKYISLRDECWAHVKGSTQLQKFLVPGRLVLICHTPWSMVGRIGVVVDVCAEGVQLHSELRYKILVPTAMMEERLLEERIRDYQALTDAEERRWRREQLILRHIFAYGLDRMDSMKCSLQHESYRLLDDVTIDSVMGVCRAQVRAFDPEKVIADSFGRWGPHKEPELSEVVQRYINEIDDFARKWLQMSGSDADNEVFLLGRDILSKDLDVHQKLNFLVDQRKVLAEALNNRIRREDFADSICFACLQCQMLTSHLDSHLLRVSLEELKERLMHQTSSSGLVMSEDYLNRLKVLRFLNYVDQENMVSLKGKVACEISTQELLISELILENKFMDPRGPPEIAAMLSALTCQFKSRQRNHEKHFLSRDYLDNRNDAIVGAGGEIEAVEGLPSIKRPIQRVPPSKLKELTTDVMLVAERIDKVQTRFKLGDSIVRELNFELLEPVYHWASGLEFADIMTMTDPGAEGLIVRCIQRLDELCKDIRKAARVVGDVTLFEKMEQTSEAIHRDIVFAASLYTTDDDLLKFDAAPEPNMVQEAPSAAVN